MFLNFTSGQINFNCANVSFSPKWNSIVLQALSVNLALPLSFLYLVNLALFLNLVNIACSLSFLYLVNLVLMFYGYISKYNNLRNGWITVSIDISTSEIAGYYIECFRSHQYTTLSTIGAILPSHDLGPAADTFGDICPFEALKQWPSIMQPKSVKLVPYLLIGFTCLFGNFPRC